MVFEGVIAEVLDRFLGSFLQEVTRKQLKIGLFNGDAVLKNIEVKPEAFKAFDLPITVNRGVVGRLQVKIPWTSLKSEPVVIHLQDIYILAGSGGYSNGDGSGNTSSWRGGGDGGDGDHGGNSDKQGDSSSVQFLKFLKLDKRKSTSSSNLNNSDTPQDELDDSNQDDDQQQQQQQEKETKKKKDGFKEKLVAKIINNLQIVIERLHIRYEHNASNITKDLALGVSLERLFIQTADADWNPVFVESNASVGGVVMNKLAELSNISVYLDHNSQTLINQSTKQLSETLRNSIPTISDTKGHSMLLDPLSAILKLQLHQSSTNILAQNSITKIEIETVIEEIGLSMEPRQYSSLLALLESLSEFVHDFKEEQQNSSSSAFETLIKKTLALKELKSKKSGSSSNNLEKKEKALKKKEDKKKEKQEKKELKEKEKREKEEAKRRKKEEKRLSLGGGDLLKKNKQRDSITLSNQTNTSTATTTSDSDQSDIEDIPSDDEKKGAITFDVETPNVNMSEQTFERVEDDVLKQQIYDTIGYVSPPPHSTATPSSSTSPTTTTTTTIITTNTGREIVINVNIKTIHIKLMSDDTQEGALIFGDISGIKITMLKKLEVLQLKAELKSIRLSGLWVENDEFPDMISSGMSNAFLLFQMQMITNQNSQQQQQQIGNDPNVGKKITIGIQVSPIYFVLNSTAILRYLKLITPSHRIDLSGFTNEKLDEKKSSITQPTPKLSKLLDLNIQLASPTLIIPITTTSTSKDNSILILDLGKVSMNGDGSGQYKFQLDDVKSFLSKPPSSSSKPTTPTIVAAATSFKSAFKPSPIPFSISDNSSTTDSQDDEDLVKEGNINKTQLWCLKELEYGKPVFSTGIEMDLVKRSRTQSPALVPNVKLSININSIELYFSPYIFYQIRMFSHLLMVEIERVERALLSSFQFKLNVSGNQVQTVLTPEQQQQQQQQLQIEQEQDEKISKFVNLDFSATVNRVKLITTNLVSINSTVNNQNNNNNSPRQQQQEIIFEAIIEGLTATIIKQKYDLKGEFNLQSIRIYDGTSNRNQIIYSHLNNNFLFGNLLMNSLQEFGRVVSKSIKMKFNIDYLYGQLHPQILGNIIELIQLITIVNDKVTNSVLLMETESKPTSTKKSKLGIDINSQGFIIDLIKLFDQSLEDLIYDSTLPSQQQQKQIISTIQLLNPLVSVTKQGSQSTKVKVGLDSLEVLDKVDYQLQQKPKDVYCKILSTSLLENTDKWVQFGFEMKPTSRKLEANVGTLQLTLLPQFLVNAKDFVLDLFQYIPFIFTKENNVTGGKTHQPNQSPTVISPLSPRSKEIVSMKKQKTSKLLQLNINVKSPILILPHSPDTCNQLLIHCGDISITNQQVKTTTAGTQRKELTSQTLAINISGVGVVHKYSESSMLDILEGFQLKLSLTSISDPSYFTLVDCESIPKLSINIESSDIVLNVNDQMELLDQLEIVFKLLPLVKDFKTEMKSLKQSLTSNSKPTTPILLPISISGIEDSQLVNNSNNGNNNNNNISPVLARKQPFIGNHKKQSSGGLPILSPLRLSTSSPLRFLTNNQSLTSLQNIPFVDNLEQQSHKHTVQQQLLQQQQSSLKSKPYRKLSLEIKLVGFIRVDIPSTSSSFSIHNLVFGATIGSNQQQEFQTFIGKINMNYYHSCSNGTGEQRQIITLKDQSIEKTLEIKYHTTSINSKKDHKFKSIKDSEDLVSTLDYNSELELQLRCIQITLDYDFLNTLLLFMSPILDRVFLMISSQSTLSVPPLNQSNEKDLLIKSSGGFNLASSSNRISLTNSSNKISLTSSSSGITNTPRNRTLRKEQSMVLQFISDDQLSNISRKRKNTLKQQQLLQQQQQQQQQQNINRIKLSIYIESPQILVTLNRKDLLLIDLGKVELDNLYYIKKIQTHLDSCDMEYESMEIELSSLNIQVIHQQQNNSIIVSSTPILEDVHILVSIDLVEDVLEAQKRNLPLQHVNIQCKTIFLMLTKNNYEYILDTTFKYLLLYKSTLDPVLKTRKELKSLLKKQKKQTNDIKSLNNNNGGSITGKTDITIRLAEIRFSIYKLDIEQPLASFIVNDVRGDITVQQPIITIDSNIKSIRLMDMRGTQETQFADLLCSKNITTFGNSHHLRESAFFHPPSHPHHHHHQHPDLPVLSLNLILDKEKNSITIKPIVDRLRVYIAPQVLFEIMNYIMEPQQAILPTYKDKINRLNRKYSTSSPSTANQTSMKKKPSISIEAIANKLKILLVENPSSIDSNLIIAKVTINAWYDETNGCNRVVRCNLNQLQAFTFRHSIIGVASSRVASIIDPVDIQLSTSILMARDSKGIEPSMQIIEIRLKIDVLNLFLSYHDTLILASIVGQLLTSLPTSFKKKKIDSSKFRQHHQSFKPSPGLLPPPTPTSLDKEEEDRMKIPTTNSLYIEIDAPQLALTLINDHLDQNMPLLDISLYRIQVLINGVSPQISISMQSRILADYFNSARMAYEPLIENWNFNLLISKGGDKQQNQSNSGPSGATKEKSKLNIQIISKESLNINVTYELARTFLTTYSTIKQDLDISLPTILSLFKNKKSLAQQEKEIIKSSDTEEDKMKKINNNPILALSPSISPPPSTPSIVLTTTTTNTTIQEEYINPLSIPNVMLKEPMNESSGFLTPSLSSNNFLPKSSSSIQLEQLVSTPSPLLQTISIKKLTSSFHPFWILNKLGIDIEYQVIEQLTPTTTTTTTSPPDSIRKPSPKMLFNSMGSSNNDFNLISSTGSTSNIRPTTIILENESKQPVQLDAKLLLSVKNNRDFRGYKQEIGEMDNGPFISVKLNPKAPLSIPVAVGKIGTTIVKINNRKIVFQVGWNDDGSKLITILSNVTIINNTTLNLELNIINDQQQQLQQQKHKRAKSVNNYHQVSNTVTTTTNKTISQILFPGDRFIIPLQYLNSNKRLSILPNHDQVEYKHSNPKTDVLPLEEENLNNLYKITTSQSIISTKTGYVPKDNGTQDQPFYRSIILVLSTKKSTSSSPSHSSSISSFNQQTIDNMIQDHLIDRGSNKKKQKNKKKNGHQDDSSLNDSRIIDQDEIIDDFIGVEEEEEIEEPIIINILPPIQFENLLPCPIRIAQYQQNQYGKQTQLVLKVKSQQTLPLYSQDPRNNVEVIIADVPGYPPTSHLLVDTSTNQSNHSDSIKTKIEFKNDQQHMKPLNVYISSREIIQEIRVLSFYTLYWIINKTGLSLIYGKPKLLSIPGSGSRNGPSNGKESKIIPQISDFYHPTSSTSSSLKDCEFDKMVLYHSTKLILQLPTSTWSNTIPLETVGSVNLVYCEDLESQGEYNFRATISLGKGNLQRTKMVTIDYQYTICNNTEYPILVRQADVTSGENQEILVAVGGKEAFHWPSKYDAKHLQIKFQDDNYSWSGAFSIEDLTLVTVKIRNWTNSLAPYLASVEVDSLGHVTIGPEDINPPYRIENNTPRTIRYIQSGCLEKHQYDILPPFTHSSYAWDELMGTRILVLDVADQGQQPNLIKLNIMKIKSFKPVKISPTTMLYSWVKVEGPTRVLVLTFEKIQQQQHYHQMLLHQQQHQDLVEIGQLDLSIQIPRIGISLVDGKPKELLYISLNDITMEYSQSNKYSRLELIMTHFQIDNQLINTDYPVLFYPTVKSASIFDQKLGDAETLEESKPFLHFSFVKNQENKDLLYFEMISLLIQESNLLLDDRILGSIVDMSTNLGALFKKLKPNNQQTDEKNQSTTTLARSGKKEKKKDKKAQMIYIKLLLLQPVKVILTFSFARDGLRQQSESDVVGILLEVMGISFSLERTPIHLNSLILEHPFLSRRALLSRIRKHYTYQSLNQLYKVLGSSDSLGNPVGLFNHLSLGVKDFFYEPALGLIRSPKHFAIGLTKGSISLLKNSVYGLFNSISKISATVGKGISILSLDEDYLQKRQRSHQKKAKHVGQGLAYGSKELVKGVVDGVTGLVRKPIEGAQKRGVEGLAKGVAKGILGVAVKPTVGVFDFASKTAEGIRNTTNLFVEIQRIRPPRSFGKEKLLIEYNHDICEGKYILESTHKGVFKNDLYITHFCHGKFTTVITQKRIIYVGSGNRYPFKWAARFDNIKTVERQVNSLLLTFNKVQKMTMLLDYRSQCTIPIGDNDQLIHLFSIINDNLNKLRNK